MDLCIEAWAGLYERDSSEKDMQSCREVCNAIAKDDESIKKKKKKKKKKKEVRIT